jgi:hypothetical protein
MATIAQAVAAKVLEVVPLPPWEKRQAIRCLWATPDLLDWIDESEELQDPKRRLGQRTLGEHLWQFFANFRCSDRPSPGDLRVVMPPKKGVAKMHPPGLRIYGFVPAPHQFVAVAWAFEQQTKDDKSLNDKKREEVLAFIRAHGLEGEVRYGSYDKLFPA